MKSIRIIVSTWVAWAIIIIAFQALSSARVDPKWPDRALDWTPHATGLAYQRDQPYLLEPFLNDQVAWDSEYYLAIAVGGYDDPGTDVLGPPGHEVTKSYAFFPFYPWMIRLLAFPVGIFGLNPIATAALAGVIVSAVGTLFGMLALYDLTRDRLGEDGALRAAFYLIIFPTGFFLIQVYTEGLFVGLAFSCLAMLKRGHWVAVALLGSCATLTRAVGVLVMIPMAMTWLGVGTWGKPEIEWRHVLHRGLPLRKLGHLLALFSPLIVFLIWRLSHLGVGFDFVERNLYQRGFLSLGDSLSAWTEAFRALLEDVNPQQTAYYLTEFFGLAIGIVTCIAIVKIHPEIAWFSLAVLIVSWGSGPAQSIQRYILGAPAVFVALARWGGHPVFDRAWTLLSILLMGLLSMLFALNMWVA